MGILQLGIQVSVDFGVGALTGAICEFVFPAYDANKNEALQLVEGLLELIAIVAVSTEIAAITGPDYAERNIAGNAILLWTALNYAPNMQQKLRVGWSRVFSTISGVTPS